MTVYTLHTALMAGLILLLLRWADNPTPRRLAMVGLVVGLGLSHHASMVLLLPACAWYVLTTAPRRALAPSALLPALLAGLVGLSFYLYLPLRMGAAPAFNYAGWYDASGMFQPVNLRTFEGFWWLVSGRSFANEMMAYSGAELWREIGPFGVRLWRAFFAIGIGPGLLGLIVLLRRNWRLGGLLLLMFIGNTAFYIEYRVVDKDTMFLSSYLIWALWLGFGYQWLLMWARDAAQRWSQRLLRVVLVSSVVIAMVWNWRLVDLSNDWSTRIRAETILDIAEPHALIFGW